MPSSAHAGLAARKKSLRFCFVSGHYVVERPEHRELVRTMEQCVAPASYHVQFAEFLFPGATVRAPHQRVVGGGACARNELPPDVPAHPADKGAMLLALGPLLRA